MNMYFSILFCIAISHGFPNKVKDPEFPSSDTDSNSINNDEVVSIEQKLSTLVTSSNVTAEDPEHEIINSFTGTNGEVEPRFIKRAAIGSVALIAAKSLIAHNGFRTFFSFLPFFKIRKVITVVPDATAVIVPGTSKKVHGRLLFFNADHGINIVGEIRGLSSGRHGIHIHTSGNIGNLCMSTWSHFNPTNSNHGGPSASVRHIGDLGNIVARRDGIANVDIFDRLISLDPQSAHYIGSRAIVIHAAEDDLGYGWGAGDALTLSTGNSGSRVGCGLIVKEFTRHV